MLGVVAALALAGGSFLSGGRDVHVHRYLAGHWGLTVRQDRFNGVTTCTIQRRNVSYAEGVVTFHFGQGVDTANAHFRVGGQPAHDVGSVAIEAAGLGARFLGPNLGNPSNGEVHIPADIVGEATTVAIKPNRKMSHRTFDLTGLSRAVEAAKAQKCDDLAGRVRLGMTDFGRLGLPTARRAA